MIIILFGAPGVGKGTQASILADKLGVAHLSTGDAFRSAIKNETEVAARSPVPLESHQRSKVSQRVSLAMGKVMPSSRARS